jgi:hypothetical protein
MLVGTERRRPFFACGPRAVSTVAQRTRIGDQIGGDVRYRPAAVTTLCDHV